jgi:hypothetical protein
VDLPVNLQPTAAEALWAALAGKDASQAFEAMRQLTTHPRQAIALIKERVRPISPADPIRLTQLVADLQSEQFEPRQQAESELRALGDLAGPALRKALAADPPLDVRQRLERLVDRLRKQTDGTAQLRELRAIELLELIGTPDACQVLQAIAAGAPGARLTLQATGAMQRLGRYTH